MLRGQGGPDYINQNVFDINSMQPYTARELIKAARRVTANVVLYLPRQSNQMQIAALQAPPGLIELQYLMCSGFAKGELMKCYLLLSVC